MLSLRGVVPLSGLLVWGAAFIAQAETVCVPDKSGISWNCVPKEDFQGSVPPLLKAPAADAQIKSPAPGDTEPDPKLDPLTGLSLDPADWYIPTPARAVAPSHNLQTPVAQRYYVRRASSGQCPGGYEVRVYPHPTQADDSSFPLVAEADTLSATLDQEAVLTGNVTVEQGNRRLYAPVAELDQTERMARFPDGMLLDQPGLVMQGGDAEFNIDSKAAEVSDAEFILTDINFRGEAQTVEQSSSGDLLLKDNEFTRCEPGNNGWRMNTGSLLIEQDEVFGTARNATLRMKGVPVFYTPYLKFPVSDERVSGFLFPNMSFSSEDGVDVTIPYYLNLAPNYDATIIPRVVGERGVGIEAEFRHMSAWQQTIVGGAILPDDKLFDGTFDKDDFEEQGGEAVFGPFEPEDRWLGAVQHQGYLGDFRTFIDYSAVSDRDYYRDLGSDLATGSRRELERKGEIQFNRGGLFARVWAQGFQRLDEVTVDQYERLPELELTYGGQILGPLEADIGVKWSDFDRDTEGLSGIAAITGSRLHVEPRVRLPFSWPFGFLTFGGGYRHTTYDLERDTLTPLDDDAPERGIGMGYVDGGLFFERDLSLFSNSLIQTLEPRVYYLWQDYEDQSELPLFDSSALTFGYSQLFRGNRFSGVDRIADAKQVSLGVTSRFVSAENGREYFRASVGQIFHLIDRRVTLTGNPGIDEEQSSSPLAGELAASLGGAWRLFGTVVWDPHDNQVDEGGGGIGYRRDNRHIFNIGYRNRVENDIEQWDVSLYWPLTRNVSVLGRWNYDIVSGRTIEGFGGLEYSDCCLQVRLMARRFLDSRTNRFADVEADDGIFLQIVFKGLAGFGTKVESVLERGIRGYRSPTQSDFFTN